MAVIATTQDDIFAAMESPQTEVISFDVFDTLLVRPVLEPADLFSLMDDLWQSYCFSGGFTQVRKLAESRAKAVLKQQDATKTEPGLDAIYEELEKSEGVSRTIAAQLKNREIDDERRWLSARQGISSVYEQAVSSGKRLIAVSDTYHDRDFISSVLRENGFEQIEQVFVSSEFGVTKAEGSLFPLVLDRLGLEGNRILHIGDNHRSDIVNAGKFGLTTAHVPPTVFAYFSRFSTAAHWAASPVDLSPGAKMLLGLVVNKCGDTFHVRDWDRVSTFNGDLELLGYGFLGPALFFAKTDDEKNERRKTSAWLDSIRTQAETSKELQTLLAAARAFCSEAEALLREKPLHGAEKRFLSNAFLQLPFNSKSRRDQRVLELLPPLPSDIASPRPSLARQLELLLLRRLIYQRAFVRLISSRQTYFKSVKSPFLRAYAKWGQIV